MIAAEPPPPVTATVPADHVLSPTGTAVLLVLGFAIDYFAVFPAWMQTRLLFAIVATVAREGFDGSSLDRATVQHASSLIQSGLDATDGAYIAGASAQAIVGCLVGLLSIYSVGCMLPVQVAKKTGRLATATFKETGLRKLNFPVWGMAFALGLLADLPVGWMGSITQFCLGLYTTVTAPLPSLVFGVS